LGLALASPGPCPAGFADFGSRRAGSSPSAPRCPSLPAPGADGPGRLQQANAEHCAAGPADARHPRLGNCPGLTNDMRERRCQNRRVQGAREQRLAPRPRAFPRPTGRREARREYGFSIISREKMTYLKRPYFPPREKPPRADRLPLSNSRRYGVGPSWERTGFCGFGGVGSGLTLWTGLPIRPGA